MTPEMIGAAPGPSADEYPELEGVVTEDGKPLGSTYQERRAERMAARLRERGVDPDSINGT